VKLHILVYYVCYADGLLGARRKFSKVAIRKASTFHSPLTFLCRFLTFAVYVIISLLHISVFLDTIYVRVATYSYTQTRERIESAKIFAPFVPFPLRDFQSLELKHSPSSRGPF